MDVIRRALPLVLLTALLGVLFAACLQDENGSNGTATPDDETETATATDSPSQQAATQTPPGDSTATAPGLARDGFNNATPYTVKPGDTLFSIATAFGTTVEAIATLNAIEDPASIEVGWVIYIPQPPPATPTPIPSGPSLRLDHGSRSSGIVALTFDMGGRVEPALDIMNFLVANQVRATIFMTGAMVDNQNTDAGRQVLAIIEAHPGLFELGNHSYSHPDFTTLTAAEMRDELSRTEASIANYVDVSPRPMFRPPFGAVNQAVLDAVGPAGYAYTVMWDVDTVDWRPEAEGGPTAAEISSKVLNNAQGGSIVLMHLGGYNTFEALPAIVQGLRADGYTLGTVGDLVD